VPFTHSRPIRKVLGFTYRTRRVLWGHTCNGASSSAFLRRGGSEAVLRRGRSSRRETSPESGTWASLRFLKAPAAPRRLKTGLRNLGYLDGEVLVIEYRWANGRHEQLDVLATELVRMPVDVIVAPTTAAAVAARNATATIPIVFATVSRAR